METSEAPAKGCRHSGTLRAARDTTGSAWKRMSELRVCERGRQAAVADRGERDGNTQAEQGQAVGRLQASVQRGSVRRRTRTRGHCCGGGRLQVELLDRAGRGVKGCWARRLRCIGHYPAVADLGQRLWLHGSPYPCGRPGQTRLGAPDQSSGLHGSGTSTLTLGARDACFYQPFCNLEGRHGCPGFPCILWSAWVHGRVADARHSCRV